MAGRAVQVDRSLLTLDIDLAGDRFRGYQSEEEDDMPHVESSPTLIGRRMNGFRNVAVDLHAEPPTMEALT
jgi:hypothetical protein